MSKDIGEQFAMMNEVSAKISQKTFDKFVAEAKTEFEREHDIEKVEVGKWVELHITLKDGTFISTQITPELDNTDWKWSSMDSYLDEDWNPIDEDELFPETYVEEEA